MDQPDPTQTIFFNHPEGLARMLALDGNANNLWAAGEMQVIWQHQLSAPIGVDLGLDAPSGTREPGSPSDLKQWLSQSFGQLLADPQAPLALLKKVKDFAKQTIHSAEDAQMKGVGGALYYAAYAAGMVRGQQRIGGLEDAGLRRGFQWALSQEWLDPATRKLIGQAADLLPAGS